MDLKLAVDEKKSLQEEMSAIRSRMRQLDLSVAKALVEEGAIEFFKINWDRMETAVYGPRHIRHRR